MSEDTADIVGPKNSKVMITIDTGTIEEAYLEVPGQAKTPLPVSGGDQEVTVASLPSGDSTVRLDIVWGPGDTNSTVDLGTGTSEKITICSPKPIIYKDHPPGYVELFGTQS